MASNKRSLVKTLTYRVGTFVLVSMCVWLMTGRIRFSVGIAFVEMVGKSCIYFIHERIWARIKWGAGDTLR